MSRILFLDDVRDPEWVLGSGATAVSDITVVRSFEEAIEVVTEQEPFDVWWIDHDLGMEVLGHHGDIVSATEKDCPSGYDFLVWAVEHAKDKWPRGRVYVHSANPSGAARMRALIKKEGGSRW